MNETEQTILLGSGLIALAIIASGFIISHKLARALDEKNFWDGSNIPGVISDVRQVTQPLAQISDSLTRWTRA